MTARNASRVLSRRTVRAVRVLLFLGVIAAASGCEFVYLPECDTDCTAGGGDDSYGKATP